MLDASGCSWAMWTWALLQLLLLVGPGGCLNRQELFPFGPGQGDLELEAGDDVVSPSLELIGELSFYDRTDITSVYVSTQKPLIPSPLLLHLWGCSLTQLPTPVFLPWHSPILGHPTPSGSRTSPPTDVQQGPPLVQILPFYHTSSRKTPCVCFSKASSHKTASRNTSHDTTESPEKPDISTSA